MQKKSRFRLVAAILAGCASMASAHTLSLSTITAEWFAGSPSSNVSYLNNATADASARWGAGTPQSGLEFKVAGQPITFTVNNTTTQNQTVGNLTHTNSEIESGTGITDVRLKIRSNVLLDGISQGIRTFEYAFNILETPNNAAPCADGGQVGVGADINGCADRVTLGAMPSPQDFTIGNEIYRLNLLGFSLDQAGTKLVNFFWTPEQSCFCTYLVANVTPLRSPVPEPAVLPLLGLGLICLAFARRRQRAPCKAPQTQKTRH